MKRTYLILGVNGLFLIVVLIFVKYEMDQNRKQLTQELTQSMHDTPGKIARDAIGQLGQDLTNAPATNAAPQSPGNDVLGSLFGVAANAVQRAGQIAGTTASETAGRVDQLLTNNAATNGAGQPATNDPLGALLNLGADAAHRVDQAALGATALTDDEEMEFGRQLDSEILKDMPEDTNSASEARLESLAKGLASQCQRKQIQYHFRVLSSPVVNAFSIAGGYVYVTTNYLKRFPSDGELVMTLGHEIAHVELKHAVEKVQYEYHGQKIFGGLASVAQVGYAMLSSPYAKEQEFDADAWGFATAKKAGWDPAKLLVLFDNLEKFEQEQQPPATEAPSEFERRLGDYFASHPRTADRLARLKGM